MIKWKASLRPKKKSGKHHAYQVNERERVRGSKRLPTQNALTSKNKTPKDDASPSNGINPQQPRHMPTYPKTAQKKATAGGGNSVISPRVFRRRYLSGVAISVRQKKKKTIF